MLYISRSSSPYHIDFISPLLLFTLLFYPTKKSHHPHNKDIILHYDLTFPFCFRTSIRKKSTIIEKKNGVSIWQEKNASADAEGESTVVDQSRGRKLSSQIFCVSSKLEIILKHKGIARFEDNILIKFSLVSTILPERCVTWTGNAHSWKSKRNSTLLKSRKWRKRTKWRQ